MDTPVFHAMLEPRAKEKNDEQGSRQLHAKAGSDRLRCRSLDGRRRKNERAGVEVQVVPSEMPRRSEEDRGYFRHYWTRRIGGVQVRKSHVHLVLDRRN